MRTLVLLLVAVVGIAAPMPSNRITITGWGGDGTLSPFTISRFFAQGDINHCAQARVSGQLVETQCDVKTRWPDGSVQHALISFFAPVTGDSPIPVEFVDQSTGNNDNPLSQAAMLSFVTEDGFGGWGARIEAVANGVTQSADATTMLINGAWRYWLQGRICTQVILEGPRDNERAAISYDFGWQWDGTQWISSEDPKYRSVHPIFVLTFYRGWRGVKIEYLLENVWTTRLQDQQYAVTLYKDNPVTPLRARAARETVYSHPVFTQPAKTRWRKIAWSGEEPAPVTIDYNLPYLIYSRVLPNYDLTKVVSADAIAQEVTAFRATDQGDLDGKGQWQPYFPKVGGRADIGLFPRWYVRYLYTFDPGLYDVLQGNAEVSGYMPIHYRESATGRPFDSARTADAFGRPLSIDARPTVRTTSQAQDTKVADAIIPVGTVTTGKWTVDMAHQPSVAFIPYLITGDWYFLEEIYFWASYNVARGNPGTTQAYVRHADWGFINNDQEIRGVAWGLRNLAHAALAAPDGTPEKAYYTEKLNNSLAIREGIYGITDGAFYSACQTNPYNAARETSKWCWGRNTAAAGQSNPLYFLEPGNSGLVDGLDKTKVYAGTSPWMLNFNHIVFGYLKELGFPVAKLQETLARNLLNQFVNPDYNPYLVASYRIPVLGQPGKNFFSSWADVRAGYVDPDVSEFRSVDAHDVEHGYTHIARAAASFLPGLRDGTLLGESAWAWINSHLGTLDLLNDNPKWAFSPRKDNTTANPADEGP
jgi:hypothetical protein